MRYTVTVKDTGQTPYTGATFTASLAGSLDDASYGGDATATSGTVGYVSPNLTWTGDLAPGGTAIITFSATVSNPDSGDKTLRHPRVDDDREQLPGGGPGARLHASPSRRSRPA